MNGKLNAFNWVINGVFLKKKTVSNTTGLNGIYF
jgi:hypothetical protein